VTFQASIRKETTRNGTFVNLVSCELLNNLPGNKNHIPAFSAAAYFVD